ncbi:hypothetical protein [Paraburkholderia tropica]|uniref:glycan biosynthesis hexose transferase WsfD n=1 Tax=Paraburkholderia tropica TaxID=92647 RepID=UPI001F2468EA|nr:hypothetical protein [Paraburkholderia tropica]
MRYKSATLGALIIIVTIVKMVLIIGSPKLIALSNNWDFIRTESCMGLWQNYGDGTAKTDAHLKAPVNSLVLDRGVKMDQCVVSIDSAFPYIVSRFHKVNDHVDFHAIGYLRLASVFIALGFLLSAARGSKQRLVIAAIFMAIFGDIAYLLYFNTLYNEFSDFLGVFICTASLWMIWTGSTKSIRKSSLTLMAGVFLICMSKEQYSALGILFSVVGALLLFVRLRLARLASGLLAVGVFSALSFSMINQSDFGLPSGIKLANITDAVLGEVLPYATNRDQALKTLNLPPECEKGIGDTWYTPGVPENHPCPSLINVHRMNLIPLFIKQPKTFFYPIRDALWHAYPVPDHHYGLFEYPGDADSLRYRLVKATSLTTYMNRLPKMAFRWIMTVAMAIGVVASIWCLFTIRRTDKYGSKLLWAIGGVTLFYVMVSSVFGDGIADTSRHAILWPFGITVQIMGTLLFLAERFAVSKSTVRAELPEVNHVPAG